VSSALPPAAVHEWRTLGRAVVDRLARYLEASGASEGAVLPWREPDSSVCDWPVDGDGGADLLPLLDRVAAESNHLHHRGSSPSSA